MHNARILRWILLPLCLYLSMSLEALWQGISLAISFIVYNELHLDSHWLMRNACNAWGYASFNAGASAIAGAYYLFTPFTPYSLMTVRPALGQSTMTSRTLISFAVNALIIISTIHAQDFRDEVGDKLMGRRSIPIVWPEESRVSMLVLLPTWSVGLSWACDLAIPFSVPFCCLSLYTGLRFIQKRTADADRRSFLYYNVRFLLMYVMLEETTKLFPLLQIWLVAAQVVHIQVLYQ